MQFLYNMYNTITKRKPALDCGQGMCRSACASAQTYQHVPCSLSRQYNTFIQQNLYSLASNGSPAGRLVFHQVGTPTTGFHKWEYSCLRECIYVYVKAIPFQHAEERREASREFPPSREDSDGQPRYSQEHRKSNKLCTTYQPSTILPLLAETKCKALRKLMPAHSA